MSKCILKNITKKIALASLCLPFSLVAQTPTSTQMAQFKSLPKAQQEQLAKQYGYDLNTMAPLNKATEKVQRKSQKPRKIVKSVEYDLDMDENQLTPYGYDVLAGSPDSFIMSDDFPVPNDYLIGPGDELKIEIYGKENREVTLAVSREGVVNIPSLGPVNASGLTFSEFRTLMIKSIKNKVIGVEVIVSMGSMRMMQVYIVGESNQPGAYNVSGITTITQALIASGGVKKSGSLRNIQLKRKGKVITTLDMYELLLKGNTLNDIRIEGGDTLFIPTINKTVSIGGAIQRPAIYEFTQPIKLIDLINIAGGTDITAYLSKISVQRITSNGKTIETVDLTTSSGKNFVIKDGDEIQIAKLKDSTESGISIRGTVARQGGYEFTVGMKVSDLLTSVSSDLMVSTDLEYALIVREINAKRDISVLQFNLGKAISSPLSSDNIKLQDRDQIFVFSNSLDVDFWLGIKDKTAEDLKNESKSQVNEDVLTQNSIINNSEKIMLDADTGAEIESSEVIKSDNTLTASELSDTVLLNIREKQLRPILTRLKKQASLTSPVQIVDISGDVIYPGSYPLTLNANINTLLSASGGLLESAYIERAELSRISYENNALAITRKHISLSNDNNKRRLISLKAKDRLNILTKPGWTDEYSVSLQGEVLFPGTYTFKRGATIFDILKRAGGLTQFADRDGAVFSREKLKKREQVQMEFLQNQLKQQITGMALRTNSTSTSSPTESMGLVEELGNLKPMGRMVINLPKILEGDKTFDIVLADGDKLYIQEKDDVTSIVGEVQFTSSHTFNPHEDVNDYITLAGGMREQADSDKIYVVRANGSVFVPNNSFWFSRKSEALRPGDTIIVPLDINYQDGLTTIATATQIVYQLGVAWSAIQN